MEGTVILGLTSLELLGALVVVDLWTSPLLVSVTENPRQLIRLPNG